MEQADSDEYLLDRIIQQDDKAFEQFYDRYAQAVYNLICRIVRNRSIADELLQETFWQVWKNAAQYSGQGSVPAWLMRIARNKSLDELRRQKVRPQAADPVNEEDTLDNIAATAEKVEQRVEQAWQHRSLHEAMRRIPLEQRHCLNLAYFEGLTCRQIAEQTQLPEGTIRTRMRLGMKKLHQFLVTAQPLRSDQIS